MKKHTQQTLALAGVVQAAFLANQLARHGAAGSEKLRGSLDSLFVTNPKRTEDVYGRVSCLNLGLQVLQELLQTGGGLLKSPEVLRYSLALLYLDTRLRRTPALLERIANGLRAIEIDFPERESSNDPDVVRRLGRLYQETLGTLSFRIQVKGEPQFLRNELVAARIRAVLLAGIRSAVLWRQLGGHRWHLLVHRRRMARDVLLLLSNTQDLVH